ncbi:formylglycine-generating enzyme family protein [Candidatus Thiosymbion oneisti]|uniref:formylglycine-generating enzyme family protein n=1 Tax=Candidatus Thiosymbion oneisti TaxID=589554 RepID=UPI001414F96D|nr:formylglycine-generating enzyme family protein [Candidatus Thiosymbion oneisti]
MLSVVLILLLALLIQGAEEASGFAPGTLPAEPCVSRPGEGPQMVLIESGRFRMGSPAEEEGRSSDEGPRHPVAVVRPFALARCETTVGEFGRFVAETGYRTDAERDGDCYTVNADGSGFQQREDASWRNPGFAQSDDHPVVCVSFNDARVYARWLSLRTGAAYRLPTEAEWEYAARAGTNAGRFWGDDPDASCVYSNGADQAAKARFPDWTIADCDDGAEFTAPAGRYQRNPFGLSDILGNVWEWVEDCWHEGYTGAPTDGSAWREAGGGDCARRVLRGGGWNFFPRWLRSASRNGGTADEAGDFVGIRLARTL